jgi:hypothetical protein
MVLPKLSKSDSGAVNEELGPAEMTPIISTALPSFGLEQSSSAQLLSIPIGSFYDKLPEQLLTSKKPDLTHVVYIAAADVVSDEENEEATILLSILSLSCPEIFAHPIDSVNDIAITFPVSQPKLETYEDPPCTAPALAENPRSGADAGDFAESILGDTAIPGATRDEAASKSDQIRVKLEPILASLPPDFELFDIPILNDPETEIALPLDLVRTQLKNGRVAISAAAFCAALPEELKHIFEKIEPEIPIPLREIFRELPSEAIKLREDYELSYSPRSIRTPFTLQAEEDASRRSEKPEFPKGFGGESASRSKTALEPEANPTRTSQDAPQPAEIKVHGAKTVPLPNADLYFPETFESHALQALFMTEEILDLPKTIQKVSELPGIRTCLLTAENGTKLGGKLDDPSQETAVSSALRRLFQQVSSTLREMQMQSLEGMTLYCGRDTLSIFLVAELCLTVLHDNGTFRPGVREKILAVVQELGRISHTKTRP